MTLLLKRAYDKPASGDGTRILVDRLWPRGVSKVSAKIDLWLKEIAPSDALRKWFGHDPEKWPEFRKRYHQELKENPDALKQLSGHLKSGTVTLVYGAKDTEHNQAAALMDYLHAGKRRAIS